MPPDPTLAQKTLPAAHWPGQMHSCTISEDRRELSHTSLIKPVFELRPTSACRCSVVYYLSCLLSELCGISQISVFDWWRLCVWQEGRKDCHSSIVLYGNCVCVLPRLKSGNALPVDLLAPCPPHLERIVATASICLGKWVLPCQCLTNGFIGREERGIERLGKVIEDNSKTDSKSRLEVSNHLVSPLCSNMLNVSETRGRPISHIYV